jgi:hypothetical protein
LAVSDERDARVASDRLVMGGARTESFASATSFT